MDCILEKFHQFCHLLSLAEFLSCANNIFLSYANNYIEDVETFTASYATEYFCNAKVAGLGEIFTKFHIYSISVDD